MLSLEKNEVIEREASYSGALSWQTQNKYAVSGLTCYAGMELLKK